MADFYFFTEANLLNAQIATESFGAVAGYESEQYQIQSNHTSSSNPKAFAICDGTILVQEVNATIVNLIILPTTQPKQNFPKISFYIYKGILKNSLINGGEIATRNNNELTEQIWASQDAINSSIEGATGTNPNDTPSVNALGYGFTSSATTPFLISDSDKLSAPFFTITEFQLPYVKGGTHIGTFDNTAFGFLIAFESITHETKMNLARELNSIVNVPDLAATPTQAEIFAHKHAKEQILNFLDPCAFFSSFYHDTLNVYDLGSFSEYGGNDLYDNLISIFHNKNICYLDIRNEHNYSFNYYGNYGENFEIAFDAQGVLISTNYYGNFWPILSIDQSSFPTSNTTDNKNVIKCNFPIGDNTLPLLFIHVGFKDKRKFKPLKEAKKFVELGYISGDSYTNDVSFMVPNRKGLAHTTVVCSYILLRYLKRIDGNNTASGGMVIRTNDYLDNLFLPLKMSFSYLDSNQIKSRVYSDAAYIDALSPLNTDYVSDIGIAEDMNSIVFFAYPSIYRTKERKTLYDKFSLSSISNDDETDFLVWRGKQYSNIDLFKKEIVESGSNVTTLEFVNNESGTFDDLDKAYFENNVEFAISKAEYASIQTLATSSFITDYNIYLGVDNKATLKDDLNRWYTKFDLVLRGYEEISGVTQVKQVSTGITIYGYGTI